MGVPVMSRSRRSSMDQHVPDGCRREVFKQALWGAGILIAGVATQARAGTLKTDEDGLSLLPSAATSLADLHRRLRATPRRRDFKKVPMILQDEADWDHQALRELIRYAGAHKQVWDHTDLKGPWLNLMRNSLNVQVFSFKHADFLCVSATHGTAHWALYDAWVWDKYLSHLAPELATNTWIKSGAALHADPAAIEAADGVYAPADNSIPALQARGVVFIACHNGIWELSGALLAKGINPDGLAHEQLAAELTNHLIPDVVLSPGVVGTLPELQQAGFQYAR